MKKAFFIAAMASIAALACHSQQAFRYNAPVVSPQVNPDSTVTFRFNAPSAKQVTVTGDFLPTVSVTTPRGISELPGSADMTKTESGTWEYTSAKLPPELYSYSFIVDSLKVSDPSNVYMVRDTGTLTNIFLISGDRASLYAVNDVPHGTVSKVWYDSPALGMRRRMTIYTPAGYEDNDTTRYPVFYLLHGKGGDEEAWPALGRATQILDNLIASGKAVPMIVVMPNGNPSQEAAPGETHYGLVPPTANLPLTMEGTFETVFPEITAFVDSTYRTIPEKSSRAIAGLSMGGYHSCHISKEYPDMFDYIGLFSAAITPLEPTDSPIYEDMDGKLKVQFSKNPKLYWIGIGSQDFLYQTNVDFRHRLDQGGYPYTYYETSGGHIWKNWRIYLSEFLPLLFK